MKYNTDYEVSYSNNAEYRSCIMNAFQMDFINKKSDFSKIGEDIDDEDMLYLYDQDAIFDGMDTIYNSTNKNPLFNKIYETSAGKMLSLDPNIGLAIVFSYDYFSYFHCCLVDFLKNPQDFSENNDNYRILMNKLTIL